MPSFDEEKGETMTTGKAKRIKCRYCQLSYSAGAGFKSHLRSKHPDKAEEAKEKPSIRGATIGRVEMVNDDLHLKQAVERVSEENENYKAENENLRDEIRVLEIRIETLNNVIRSAMMQGGE